MPFPVVFDQWGQNVQLNKPEFIDLGTLYGTPGFNTLSKDHRGQVNSQLVQLLEAWLTLNQAEISKLSSPEG